jgi:hypothetical protein
MDARDLISFMLGYVAIYYFNARSLLAWLAKFDEEYCEKLGLVGGVGMRNPVAIGKILFDKNLPKPTHPGGFKFRLKLTRIMLAISPVVVIAMIFLLG